MEYFENLSLSYSTAEKAYRQAMATSDSPQLCRKSAENVVFVLFEILDQNCSLPPGALELIATFPAYVLNMRNKHNDDMWGFLHYFCSRNLDQATALFLRSNNVDINIKDGSLSTPLHIVAKKYGRGDLYDLLVNYGAKADAIDEAGNTPQFYLEGHSTILSSIDPLTSENRNGDSPLMLACRNLHAKIIEACLQVYELRHIMTRNRKNESALTLSLWRPWYFDVSKECYQLLFSAIEVGDQWKINELVGLGVFIHLPDLLGRLALNWAVQCTNAYIYKWMHVWQHANSDLRDFSGISARMAAETSDSIEIQRLSKMAPDLNNLTHSYIYLHRACRGGCARSADFFLVQPGIIEMVNQVTYKDDHPYGRLDSTVLFQACQHGHSEVVDLLLSKSETDPNIFAHRSVPSLYVAVNLGFRYIALKLIERGATANPVNNHGVKFDSSHIKDGKYVNMSGLHPLHLAVLGGHVDVVMALLTCNHDCNIRTKGFENLRTLNLLSPEFVVNQGAAKNCVHTPDCTPLMFAAQLGHQEISLVLVKAGADVNLVNARQQSALHYACIYGSQEVISLLLEAGAKTDVIDDERRTPLWWACVKGHKDIVKLLLEGKASHLICDNQDVSPEDIARLHNHGDIVSILQAVRPPRKLCLACSAMDCNVVNLPCNHLAVCDGCNALADAKCFPRVCRVCDQEVADTLVVYA